MKIKKSDIFLLIFVILAVLILAGGAAYFSVFGLSKLFAGAGLGIIIFAGIELGKLVAISAIYRKWKSLKKKLKYYLAALVIVAMFITSVGCYGYLVSSYQSTKYKIENRDTRIKLMENKKSLFENEISRYNKNIETATTRVNTITGIRTNQERRLDTLYNRKYTTVAKRTENLIGSADEQIGVLNKGIENNMKEINRVNDSVSYYDQKILELKSSDVSNEIGPLKYISDLTGMSMDHVVTYLTLLIIFLVDPFAIGLLLLFNELTLNKEEVSQVMNIKVSKLFGKKQKNNEIDNNQNDEVLENQQQDEKVKKKEEYIQLIQDASSPQPLELIENKQDEIIKIDQVEQTGESEKKTPQVYETFSEKEPIIYQEEQKISSIEEEIFSKEDENIINEIPIVEEQKVFLIEEITDISPDDIINGMIVHHDVFGRGNVLDISQDKKRVKIAFEDGKIKELLTQYAKLKKVELKPEKKEEIFVKIKEIENVGNVIELTKEKPNQEIIEETPYLEIKMEQAKEEQKEEMKHENEKEDTEKKIIERHVKDATGGGFLNFPTGEYLDIISIGGKEETVEEKIVKEEQPQPKKEEPPKKNQIEEPPLIKKEDDHKDIQQLTYDNIIRFNNSIEPHKIRFTIDRRGISE